MNWDRINTLLLVEEKTRNHPNLKDIHDAAMAELQQHAVGKGPQDEEESEDE